MNKIKIFAYKHNGDFHRLWSKSEIVLETKDYFITKTPNRVRVIEQESHFWFTKEPAICYFSKKRWFNIIIIFRPNDVLYYCNIASPILKELETLKYIDYDLDLKYFVSSKKIKILDRNEYIENKEKYNYPEWIDKKVERELKILHTWAKNEIGPFSQEFRDKFFAENFEE
ncbi:MAG: DUF402 domain-containing protein [Mycoplasmatales bacterium]